MRMVPSRIGRFQIPLRVVFFAFCSDSWQEKPPDANLDARHDQNGPRRNETEKVPVPLPSAHRARRHHKPGEGIIATRGDVTNLTNCFLQNFVQQMQRKDMVDQGGECSTLQSDATHLTMLPDNQLMVLTESEDDICSMDLATVIRK